MIQLKTKNLNLVNTINNSVPCRLIYLEQEISDIFVKRLFMYILICARSLYYCVMIKGVNNINTCYLEHKAYEYFEMYRGDY